MTPPGRDVATQDTDCLYGPMEIGKFIERARRKKGWSQAQLGLAVLLPQARISQFERDAGKPTLPQIVAISDATGATLDELLRGTDPPKAESGVSEEIFRLVARLGEEEAIKRLLRIGSESSFVPEKPAIPTDVSVRKPHAG